MTEFIRTWRMETLPGTCSMTSRPGSPGLIEATSKAGESAAQAVIASEVKIKAMIGRMRFLLRVYVRLRGKDAGGSVKLAARVYWLVLRSSEIVQLRAW